MDSIPSNGEEKCRFKVSIKTTSPPKIGSVITVSHMQKTSSGLPKHPVFEGVRDDVDLPEEAVNAIKKKKVYVNTPVIVDLDNPKCDGVITSTECKDKGKFPLEITKGRHVYYDNEKGTKHRITCDKKGISAYCTCEAWKYQKLPAIFRTCKHCIMIYGYKPNVPWDVLQRMKRRDS